MIKPNDSQISSHHMFVSAGESEMIVRGDWFGRGGLFYVDIAQSLAGSRGSSESVPRLA